MYLDIGGEQLIRTKDLLGIFDLDNTTVNKATREYLSEAEKTGFSKTVSYAYLVGIPHRLNSV